MKFLTLSALLVGAIAAPKPVIELRMAGNLVERNTAAPSLPADHPYGGSDAGKAKFATDYQTGSDHVFNCDYSQPTACLMPTVQAHDHHDESVAITTTLSIVDNDNHATTSESYRDVQCDKDHVHKTQIYKYDAEDYSGNKAEQITVAYFIYDTTAPLITVCGEDTVIEATNDIYLEEHYPATQYFHDQGKFRGCRAGVIATFAKDEVDGVITQDMTTKIQFNGNGDFYDTGIKFNQVGTWTVKYDVVDKSMNSDSKQKDIVVQDTKEPTIHMKPSGQDENQNDIYDVTLECSATYTDAGATCTDRLDGGIQHSTVDNVDKNLKQKFVVSYDCKDVHDRQAATKSRTVSVVDTTNPTAALGAWSVDGAVQATVQLWAGEHVWKVDEDHLGGNGHINKKQLAAGLYDEHDPGVECSDTCSTNYALTSASSFEPDFDSTTPGDYVQTYVCTDGQGLTDSISRTIKIIDNRAPLIRLNGDNPHFIEAAPGYIYNDAGATCTDEVDGDLSKDMNVSGENINGAMVGEYLVSYDCKDATGNEANTLTRTVKVEDNTIPTIYLNSKEFMVIEASFPYSDPGATAYDSLDGDISASIKDNSAKVDPFLSKGAHKQGAFTDPSVTGVYHVKYDVSDSDGNSADPVIRTVVVKDTLPPVITLEHDDFAATKDQQLNQYKYKEYPFDKSYDNNDFKYKDRITKGEAKGTGIPEFEVPTVGGQKTGYLALNEESTSSNKSIAFVAGLAVAVGGVALLALRKRKTQAKTFVMV